MSEREAFIAAICAEPDDDTCRLAFADWLDEHGEVAHAAVLCPSFYRAEIINNPSGWDQFKEKIRTWVIGRLQNRIERRLAGITASA
jgi:uncharacterized protein (TIGR02996 family)